MPTCCVCHGYYRSPQEPSDATPRPRPLVCWRCGQDNQAYERARVKTIFDFFSQPGGRALPVLSPLLVQVALLSFMGWSTLYGTPFRRSELLMAIFFTFLSFVLGRLGFAWRFRARDDSLFRSLPMAPRFSLFRLLALLPAYAAALTLVWIMILWIAANQPPDQASRSPWNAINRPGTTFLLMFVLATSITPALMLSAARSYLETFDLPQPIFMRLPLVRQVVLSEYLAQPVCDTEPPAPPRPAPDIEYHEIARTPQGGLLMTLRLRSGDKNVKVTLESDQWAHLLSAKESGPY